MPEKLDIENLETPYLAGRIFAVMEHIQVAALGRDLNSPIGDRFFSFASTSPSPAFGRLEKLSRRHLSKLRGEKRGYAERLDTQLGELHSLLREALPLTFSLEEQARFATGYYQQRQEDYNRIQAATEAKGKGE